ncbi:MAG: hypothetical protein WDW20_05340 [Neisseriaceae bacterium]
MSQLSGANIFELNWEVEVSSCFDKSAVGRFDTHAMACISTNGHCVNLFLPQ